MLPRGIGDRVKIIGDHPHAGKFGVFLGHRSTMIGTLALVRADDGDEFFVTDPANWRAVSPNVCEQCEGAMAHSRLKGRFCRRCD